MSTAASPTRRPLIAPAGVVATLLARTLVAWARWLSPTARDRLARAVAALAFGLRIRRRVTLDNLRHALPERSESQRMGIARASYANMARVFLDALCAETASEEELLRRVRIEDWGKVEACLREGRGLLVALAHLGSWELLGEAMARRGLALAAVVRPLSGAFNAELMRSRAGSGLKLIAQRGALTPTVQALRRGEVVAMLIDQALKAKAAVFVPFFGRLASTSPAISVAAMRTGAPVIVAVPVREGDGIRVFIEGPFAPQDTGDRRADTTRHLAELTAVLEQYIRRHPDQWLWMHRRWKVQPPP